MVEDYFAQAIGFNTLKEMKANLIDKGDYFEFIKPVCGITMIQKKSPRKVMRWNAAMEYAKSLNLGGFNDWCLPLKEEFPMLGILMFFCCRRKTDKTYWTASTEANDYNFAISVNLDLTTCDHHLRKEREEHVLCVRLTPEKKQLHEEEKKRLKTIQEKVAKYHGFDTLNALTSNFVDKGDYIQLKKPVCGITMIHKRGPNYNLKWLDAIRYAKNSRLAGYNDWVVPCKEELEVIFQLRNVCEIDWGIDWAYHYYGSRWWSSSINSDNTNEVICMEENETTGNSEYKYYYINWECRVFFIRVIPELYNHHDVMELREGILDKIAVKFDFDSAKHFRNNFVDKGEYVELKQPVGGILMIQKETTLDVNWNESMEYARNLSLAGFDDWFIPLKEELMTLYLINMIFNKNLGVGDSEFDGDFYLSATTQPNDIDMAIGLNSGRYIWFDKSPRRKYRISCIRVTREEKELHNKELEQTTNAIAELKNNFIDRGDYIELKQPLSGITMIQKDYSTDLHWTDAEKYSNSLNLGGFTDWVIPTKEELSVLFKIKDLCCLKPCNGVLWSSSQDIQESFTNIDTCYTDYYRTAISFYDGNTLEAEPHRTVETSHINHIYKEEQLVSKNKWKVRCVRVVSNGERQLNSERYYEINPNDYSWENEADEWPSDNWDDSHH